MEEEKEKEKQKEIDRQLKKLGDAIKEEGRIQTKLIAESEKKRLEQWDKIQKLMKESEDEESEDEEKRHDADME